MPDALGCLAPEDCADVAPRMFAVNHAAGGRLAENVRCLLDPVDLASLHCWMLGREKATRLHYHDHDECWAWLKGRTLLTIRLPDGRSDRFEIGPGWIVYCVRGVEHAHEPLEDWGCFEWVSVRRQGARTGHLTREL